MFFVKRQIYKRIFASNITKW